MHRVIDIALSGHGEPFRLHEDAYDTLRSYLEYARARLGGDADPAEVVADLEQSIGDKLAARLQPDRRVVEMADVQAVLDEIGPVNAGADADPHSHAIPAAPTQRRLMRVREGQKIAGVCMGLSVYSDVDVAWVRAIFLLLAVVTAGLFALVYLVAMFVLPVAATPAEAAAGRAG